jgi:putative GTP pyrophosphokinase
MDFWASLEHDIAYKLPEGESARMRKELRECSDVINITDLRMQNLYNILTTFRTSD